MSRLVAGDDRLWLSRSWTTRARRPGEAADAYHFVDAESFRRRREEGGFLECAPVLEHWYGTPVPVPPEGDDLVLEIDVQGAAQVKAMRPDAVVVLVVAPSEEALVERLRARGDDEEHLRRRVELGRQEVAAGRALADHEIVNDDVQRALEELRAVVAAERVAERAAQRPVPEASVRRPPGP